MLVLGLSACGFDSSYNNTNLGSVSIGQQLIDLKAAQEDGLLSDKEYRVLRTKLLRALSDSLDANTSDDDDHDREVTESDDDDDDDEWLF